MSACTKTAGCVFNCGLDINNQPVAHSGPCKTVADCRCDSNLAVWNTLPEKGHWCEVHQCRATVDPVIRAREAANAVAAVAQKAADDAAYAKKINDAVAAKNWVEVPEPRRSIEIAKAQPAQLEVALAALNPTKVP